MRKQGSLPVLLLAGAASVVMLSCDGVVDLPRPEIASITIAPEAFTLEEGQSEQYQAVLRDAGGMVLFDRQVTWSSSDSAVATVSPSGVVSALSIGTTEIAASSEGRRGAAHLTVSPRPVAIVRIEPSDAEIPTRTTLQLAAVLSAANGTPLEGRRIEWSSSDTLVLSVDSTGLVLAGNPGSASVTATSEGKSGTADLVVTPGTPETVTKVRGDAQTGRAGEPLGDSLVVLVSDAFGNPVPSVQVMWAASGGGTASPATSSSGADGRARTAWALGTATGAQHMDATVTGLPSVRFDATATEAPAVETQPASDVTSATARLNGTVNPQSLPTSVWFEWGTSATLTTYDSTAVGGIGAGSGTTARTLNLQGLAPSSTYRFRIAASNSNGVSRGAIRSFTTAAPPAVRIITFGDSNTDNGYAGRNRTPVASSYLSWLANRLAPSAPHSPRQLAGKIEARWRDIRQNPIRVVNHAVSGTNTGPSSPSDASRHWRGGPNARALVNGTTRFEAEVLGLGYVWNGGEVGYPDYPPTGIDRVQAFTPGENDFVYISMGTNDVEMTASQTVANLEWMVNRWVGQGRRADHVLITTLAPVGEPGEIDIPAINNGIRELAARRGLFLIDLATHTSDDNGWSWKSELLHVDNDPVHYSEGVRDWLAAQVVAYVAERTPVN